LFFFITDITGVDELQNATKLRQSMVKEMRKLPNPPKFAHAAEDCGTFCKQYTGAEDNAIHKGKVVQLENEKR